MRPSLVALAVAALACGSVTRVPVTDNDAGASPDAPTAAGFACVTDQDCNPDPAISALHGQCSHGVCSCKVGRVQPNGKCGPAAPPD